MSSQGSGAIHAMKSSTNGINQKFLVTIRKVKKSKERYFTFIIEDGFETVKGMIQAKSPKMEIKIYEGKEIFVKEHITHSDGEKVMAIEILDFSGKEEKSNGKHQQKTEETQPLMERQQKNDVMTSSKKSLLKKNKPIEETQKKMVSLDMSEDDKEPEELTQFTIHNFEKISDLFVDVHNWEILVRLINKTYKEFNNKMGKLTKICNVELMDRTGMKIQGAFFGDHAKQFFTTKIIGDCYRVSRAQIREENFRQKNNDNKFSKMNLLMTRNTVFIPVKNVSSIPQESDNSTSLGLVIRELDFEKQYTISVILLEIGQEVQIPKDGRTLVKQTLIVGDPEAKKSIDVVLWNRKLEFDEKWLGKTIELKNFKLNNYRDSISVVGLFRSQISAKPNHKYKQYESTMNTSDFENISSNMLDQKQTSSNQRVSKTFRELQTEIQRMQQSDVIYTELHAVLTQIKFTTKWYYESCTNQKCKKTVEPWTRCHFCGTQITEPDSRYLLLIELTDFSGSIWLTAFDEFANYLFKGITIRELKSLKDEERKEEAEKRLYQEFNLKICSKKDDNGYIKHNIIGKFGEVNVDKVNQSNVEKIRKEMEEMRL